MTLPSYYYYVSVDGQQLGPSSYDDIQKAWHGGTVNRNCLVYGEGFENWTPLEQCAEFSNLLQAKSLKASESPAPKAELAGENPETISHTSTAEQYSDASLNTSSSSENSGEESLLVQDTSSAGGSPCPWPSSIATTNTSPYRSDTNVVKPRNVDAAISSSSSSSTSTSTSTSNTNETPPKMPARPKSKHSSYNPNRVKKASAGASFVRTSAAMAKEASATNGWLKKLTCDMVPYYYNIKTNELTWETPLEFQSTSAADADARRGLYFIFDEEEGFVPAWKTEPASATAATTSGAGAGAGTGSGSGTSKKASTYQLLSDGSTRTLPVSASASAAGGAMTKDRAKAIPISVAGGLKSLRTDHSDLVLLDSLDEGLILHRIRERYKQDKIYTSIGDILLSVNPFKRLPLYSPEVVHRYHTRGNKVLPPHPFLIAANAYRNVIEANASTSRSGSKSSQSLLVSGESGSGKTEVTKQCLSFLAEVAGSANSIEQRVLEANPILEAMGNAKTTRNDNSSRFGRYTRVYLGLDLDSDSHQPGMSGQPDQPVQYRFGIVGGRIDTYLLEKSRVTHQSHGERNYHIFYQMAQYAASKCRHPSSHHDRASDSGSSGGSWWSLLGGYDIGSYLYLAQSGCVAVDGMDDRDDFAHVTASMHALGLADCNSDSRSSTSGGDGGGSVEVEVEVELDGLEGLFELLSGILFLGNVRFELDVNSGNDGCIIKQGQGQGQQGQQQPQGGWHRLCARMFGLDASHLQQALVTRTIDVKGSSALSLKANLRCDQAEENRDALAKYTYDKLFTHVVQKINQSLLGQSGGSSGGSYSTSTSSWSTIGILDIFGFEVFRLNSFEQLCINYCNEKLQQLFNEHTFKMETMIYQQEGVDFPPIAFEDNQPVVSLIEGGGGGGGGGGSKSLCIFAKVDDAVKGPGNNVEKKDRMLGKALDADLPHQHPYPLFVPSNRHTGTGMDLSSRQVFSIKHYAGTVTYDIKGFTMKNQDKLFDDLYDLMSSSSKPFVRALFPPRNNNSNNNANMDDNSPCPSPGCSPSPGGLGGRQQKTQTLASKFKGQLQELMACLRQTEPHYIRCIKPNQHKQPALFEGYRCLEQLRFSGVFEATQIRKRGYPFRFSFATFVDRYRALMSTEEGWRTFKSSDQDPAGRCRELLAATGQPFPGMRFGRSMVFFRATEYRVLELCLAIAADRVSSKIQAMLRGRMVRKYMAFVAELRPMLLDAIQTRDLQQLQAALHEADRRLGAVGNFSTTVPFALWSRAKRLHGRLVEASRFEPVLEKYAYSDLSLDENFELLFKSIEESKHLFSSNSNSSQSHSQSDKGGSSKGEEGEEVSERFAYFFRVAQDQFEAWREYRLKPLYDKAKSSLERDDLFAFLVEGQRLQYDPFKLVEAESFIGLSELELLREQHKKAAEEGNEQRAVEKEIAIKKHYLADYGHLYDDFAACPLLRSPESYAGKVWVKREAAMAQFCQHSSKPLLKSMVKHEDKSVGKRAIRLHKSVLGYAGDRPCVYPDTMALEVLRTVAEEPALVDELFLQLMKQLTNNNSNNTSKNNSKNNSSNNSSSNSSSSSSSSGGFSTSFKRTWRLLGLCFCFVGPSKELENFVHMFLQQVDKQVGRQQQASAGMPASVKEAMCDLGHRSLYHKNKNTMQPTVEVPTEADVAREEERITTMGACL